MVLPLLGSDDGVDVDVGGVDVLVGADVCVGENVLVGDEVEYPVVNVFVGENVLVGDEVEYPVVNCNKKKNYMQCKVQHRYSFALCNVLYTG